MEHNAFTFPASQHTPLERQYIRDEGWEESHFQLMKLPSSSLCVKKALRDMDLRNSSEEYYKRHLKYPSSSKKRGMNRLLLFATVVIIVVFIATATMIVNNTYDVRVARLIDSGLMKKERQVTNRLTSSMSSGEEK